jgi:hypothetical protein
MLATHLSQILRVTTLAALVLVCGCQSAPVQEMSDARQAISVAKEAGAEQLAPGDLKAAIDYLQNAEGFISEHRYDMARREAVNAKASALNALQRISSDQP